MRLKFRTEVKCRGQEVLEIGNDSRYLLIADVLSEEDLTLIQKYNITVVTLSRVEGERIYNVHPTAYDELIIERVSNVIITSKGDNALHIAKYVCGTEIKYQPFEVRQLEDDIDAKKPKVLLKSYDGIGDRLMLLPTAKTYSERGWVVDIMVAQNEEIFNGVPYIRRVLLKDDFSVDESIYDKVYDVSYKLSKYEEAYCRQHRIRATAYLCGLDPDELVTNKPDIVLTEAEIARGQELLKSCTRKKVALCIDSNDVRRSFPTNKRRSFIYGLQEDMTEVDFVLIGYKGSMSYEGTLDLRGTTTIREMFSIVYNCDAVITIDTSTLHVAGAFQKPCILLPNTIRGEWRSYPETVIVAPKVPCYPCNDRIAKIKNTKCGLDLHGFCLGTIASQRVTKELRKILEKK